MGKVIAIVNQKGGVGKTTTTINLGASLAFENRRVLVVDFDQQANATIGLGINRENIQIDVIDFLLDETIGTKAIIPEISPKLDIIPASIRLSELEQMMYGVEGKEWLLAKRLENIKDYYDFVLIDCPPSLGLSVDNALLASDSVIIPVECGFYAYDALTQMVNKVDQIQHLKDLHIEGILLTKLDNRNTFGYKIADMVKFLFPGKTFKTVISTSSHIQEAPMHGKSVIQFSFNSRGSKEYRELAKELLMNQKVGI